MGSLSNLGISDGGMAAVIVAITGVFTAFIGWHQAVSGRKTERRNELARGEIERDQQELVERRYADEVKDKLIEQINAQVLRERQAGEQWFARYLDAEHRVDQARARADFYRDQLHRAAEVIVSEAAREALLDGVAPGDVPAPPTTLEEGA